MTAPMVPPRAHRLSRTDLAIHDALTELWVAERHATVRAVGRRAGVSVGRRHVGLLRLRAAGLCSWRVGQQGTLRPTAVIVAVFE